MSNKILMVVCESDEARKRILNFITDTVLPADRYEIENTDYEIRNIDEELEEDCTVIGILK